MTNDEAIQRIEGHMQHHQMGKYPHVLIGEALNMAIAALQAQQQAEKNEPLTREEFQKMDGEPVYLHSDDYPGDCGWHVIKAVCRDEVIFTDGNIFIMSEYGTVWLAYRRKPGDNAAPVPQLTNGDRIRAMSDEELGIFLGDWADNSLLWKRDGEGECLYWLKQPAEVEDAK